MEQMLCRSQSVNRMEESKCPQVFLLFVNCEPNNWTFTFFCTFALYSDFGYYRQENSSECVEQPDLKGKVLEFCLHGKEEQLQTSG